MHEGTRSKIFHPPSALKALTVQLGHLDNTDLNVLRFSRTRARTLLV